MKKYLFFALLLICICFGLNACGQKSQTDGTTNHTSENDTADLSGESKTITIAENKKVNYALVYPAEASDFVKSATSDLFNSIQKRSGGLPQMKDDYLSNGAEYDSETFEILIGKTAYPETEQVLKQTGYGDWKICMAGNKLVVAAYSEKSLQAAIIQLIQAIKTGTSEEGTIRLSADINLSETYYEVANHFPAYDGGSEPEISNCGDDTVLALIQETTLAEYDHYLAKLEALGYTYHFANKMADNYFATYYNDEYLIHAGYYGYEKSARISVEKKTTLVPLKSENVYTPNSEIALSLSQLGLYREESGFNQNGMAFVIQLADGSFIVIDGGTKGDADSMYRYLKSKAPNGEIVIASWFVTHNHTDHSGCISNFASKYKNDVKVEQVVLNFPSAEGYLDSNTELNSGPRVSINGLPNCRVIKAHTGQKFYIRNAVVEMLYTLDSYYPEKLTIFNNSSLVFTIDMEGERLLFTGDASDEVMEILYNMFQNTNYLRCDFLQLCHHGWRNSHANNMPYTIKAYSLMRPIVVLWPTTTNNYLNPNENDTVVCALREWNAEAVRSARETYISGEDYVTIFELPYKPFSATREFLN